MEDRHSKWLRAFRLKLTIVLSAVMLLSFLFYALVAKEFPDSYWVTCGSVAAVLFVAWWWRLHTSR